MLGSTQAPIVKLQSLSLDCCTGVIFPCMGNILGVILFLRGPWHSGTVLSAPRTCCRLRECSKDSWQGRHSRSFWRGLGLLQIGRKQTCRQSICAPQTALLSSGACGRHMYIPDNTQPLRNCYEWKDRWWRRLLLDSRMHQVQGREGSRRGTSCRVASQDLAIVGTGLGCWSGALLLHGLLVAASAEHVMLTPLTVACSTRKKSLYRHPSNYPDGVFALKSGYCTRAVGSLLLGLARFLWTDLAGIVFGFRLFGLQFRRPGHLPHASGFLIRLGGSFQCGPAEQCPHCHWQW